MDNQFETQVVIYSRNGCEDDVKFIEVDGEKFEADPTDEKKPKLDDDGEKIPFKPKTDPPENETEEEKKVRLKKEEDDKKGGKKKSGADKTLEDLAKDNPAIQKLVDDKKKRDADDEKKRLAQIKKDEAAAEKSGEWKALAESRKTDLEESQKLLGQKEEILGKYVGSVKTILKGIVATIPKENLGLIPDNFSPREKLEYITKNAKILGAKVAGKGGGVGANDGDPAPTDEAKLITEIEDLRKKENKTQAEHTKIFELSKKLKAVQAANRGDKT